MELMAFARDHEMSLAGYEVVRRKMLALRATAEIVQGLSLLGIAQF